MLDISEIDRDLGYHNYKWWKKIIEQYPDDVVTQYINLFSNKEDLILLIEKESQKIQLQLDELHNTFLQIHEEKQAHLAIEAMAWSTLLGNSGIFKFEIPNYRTKDSLEKKQKYLSEFINVVKSCEKGEVSLALILASNFSHRYKEKNGIDLYLPFACVELDKELPEKLCKASRLNEILRAKLIIWVHTLIAATDIKLRGMGRELWQELETGFEDVKKHHELIKETFIEEFLIDNVYEYPKGFAPNSKSKSIVSNDIEKKLNELKKLFNKGLITQETLTQMQIEILKSQK